MHRNTQAEDMMTALPPEVSPAKRYTEADTARLLGVHRHTIERWRNEGTIKPLPMNSNNLRIYYNGTEVLKAWHTH